MREQLVQYVNLLFAGTDGVEDIREEILQNTLERFDDLVARGAAPEQAYRQAIAGIGDVGEIIGVRSAPQEPAQEPAEDYNPLPDFEGTAPAIARLMRGVAIFLYIISPIPIILLDSLGWGNVGVCIFLSIVAIATLLLLTFSGGKKEKTEKTEKPQKTAAEKNADAPANRNLERSIKKLMRTLALVLFFIVSFSTGAWLVTWLIFPIEKALEGVACACLDLKGEA